MFNCYIFVDENHSIKTAPNSNVIGTRCLLFTVIALLLQWNSLLFYSQSLFSNIFVVDLQIILMRKADKHGCIASIFALDDVACLCIIFPIDNVTIAYVMITGRWSVIGIAQNQGISYQCAINHGSSLICFGNFNCCWSTVINNNTVFGGSSQCVDSNIFQMNYTKAAFQNMLTPCGVLAKFW